MRTIRIILFSLVIIMLIFILGPRPHSPVLDPELPVLNWPLDSLDEIIALNESRVEGVKPGNASRIIWADSAHSRTEYSIVYLHGFSASAMEGYPVHEEIARQFGCNLYLPRLYGHGIQSDDAFLDLTGAKLIETANEALSVGRLIGENVILMSCSTGGTLSLYLAANHPSVYGLIMYSPNIDFYDPNAHMLTMPWGLQLARLIFKGKHREYAASEEMKKYWTSRYRLEGLIQIKMLVDRTMTEETFNKVHQPMLMGYYYKDEDHQDKIVSVKAMHEMFTSVSTPDHEKWQVPFPESGNHVINCSLTSESVDEVVKVTADFVQKIMKIQHKDSVEIVSTASGE